MGLDDWAALGIVCGAILALSTLTGLAYTRLVRPMWRYALRSIRRLNALADDLLGDEAKGIPSATQRITRVERALDRHVRWHAEPAGPADGARTNPNGTQTRRGRTQRQAPKRGDGTDG